MLMSAGRGWGRGRGNADTEHPGGAGRDLKSPLPK